MCDIFFANVHIYQYTVPEDAKVYNDAEQLKKRQKWAFFVETFKNIRVTEFRSDKLVTLEYCKEKYPYIYQFFIENYGSTESPTSFLKKNYKNKLNQDYLMDFSELTKRLNRLKK